MALLTAGTFLMDTKTSGSESKIADITSYPDMFKLPENVDVTTLSDYMHKYIDALVDTGGSLEFGGYLDTDTMALLGKTTTYESLGIWLGGTKDATNGTITPTGSVLKLNMSASVTVTMAGGGVDAAHAVTIGVTPTSAIIVTPGTINRNATEGT